MNPQTAAKNRYNRKTYHTILVRVRRDSDLYERLCEQKENGESINALVQVLLADYFAVDVPLKHYITRQTRRVL